MNFCNKYHGTNNQWQLSSNLFVAVMLTNGRDMALFLTVNPTSYLLCDFFRVESAVCLFCYDLSS